MDLKNGGKEALGEEEGRDPIDFGFVEDSISEKGDSLNKVVEP